MNKNTIITILLTILALALLGRPIDDFVNKLKGRSDWKTLLDDAWDHIVLYSRKAGRNASREVLRVYFAVTSDFLPMADRLILIAALIYVVIPDDFLPVKRFGLVGIIDDAAVVAYMENKLRRCMTKELNEKVESILYKWFGPERVFEKIDVS